MYTPIKFNQLNRKGRTYMQGLHRTFGAPPSDASALSKWTTSVNKHVASSGANSDQVRDIWRDKDFLKSMKTAAFQTGFIKQAAARGFTEKQAWSLFNRKPVDPVDPLEYVFDTKHVNAGVHPEIARMLNTQWGVHPNQLHSNTKLDDLGADDLDHVELAMLLEEHGGMHKTKPTESRVSLPYDHKFKTVGQLQNFSLKHKILKQAAARGFTEKQAFAIIPAWGGSDWVTKRKMGLRGTAGYNYLMGVVPVPQIGAQFGTDAANMSLSGPIPSLGFGSGIPKDYSGKVDYDPPSWWKLLSDHRDKKNREEKKKEKKK